MTFKSVDFLSSAEAASLQYFDVKEIPLFRGRGGHSAPTRIHSMVGEDDRLQVAIQEKLFRWALTLTKYCTLPCPVKSTVTVSRASPVMLQ